MSSAASPFRLPRLQFSLRALLLLMALVGGGIVVYRWPWVDVREIAHGPHLSTTYHRGWNGKPVKHGREVQRDTKTSSTERWFDEGELRLERHWFEGILKGETHYRDGKLHGPVWGRSRTTLVTGEHRNGQNHGEWKHASADAIVREQWLDGKRHGPRVWTTPNGQLLQTAEYERGALVKWNGQPVAEELRRWLAREVLNESDRRELLTPVTYDGTDVFRSNYGEVVYFNDDVGKPLFVYWDEVPSVREQYRGNLPLAEVLLAGALENSCTFAWRFNMLHIVPITAKSLNWRDHTGVYDVKFAEGSEQEKFWLQPATVNPFFKDRVPQRFRGIMYADEATIIELDTSAVPGPQILFGGGPLPGGLPRTRRDQFGQHLYLTGCCVEQDGNKLIIKKQATTP